MISVTLSTRRRRRADGLAARVLEPVHLYTARGTFTAADSSVNIFEVTASTYSAHDTKAQAALLGYVRTRRRRECAKGSQLRS